MGRLFSLSRRPVLTAFLFCMVMGIQIATVESKKTALPLIDKEALTSDGTGVAGSMISEERELYQTSGTAYLPAKGKDCGACFRCRNSTSSSPSTKCQKACKNCPDNVLIQAEESVDIVVAGNVVAHWDKEGSSGSVIVVPVTAANGLTVQPAQSDGVALTVEQGQTVLGGSLDVAGPTFVASNLSVTGAIEALGGFEITASAGHPFSVKSAAAELAPPLVIGDSAAVFGVPVLADNVIVQAFEVSATGELYNPNSERKLQLNRAALRVDSELATLNVGLRAIGGVTGAARRRRRLQEGGEEVVPAFDLNDAAALLNVPTAVNGDFDCSGAFEISGTGEPYDPTGQRKLQLRRPALRVDVRRATMYVGLEAFGGLRGAALARRRLQEGGGVEVPAFDLNDVSTVLNVPTAVNAALSCSGDFEVSPAGEPYVPSSKRSLQAIQPALRVARDGAIVNVGLRAIGGLRGAALLAKGRRLQEGGGVEVPAFDLNDVSTVLNVPTAVNAALSCSGDFEVSPAGEPYVPGSKRSLQAIQPALRVAQDGAIVNVGLRAIGGLRGAAKRRRRLQEGGGEEVPAFDLNDAFAALEVPTVVNAALACSGDFEVSPEGEPYDPSTGRRLLARDPPAFRIGRADATANVEMRAFAGLKGAALLAKGRRLQEGESEIFAFDLNNVSTVLNVPTAVNANLSCSGDFEVTPAGDSYVPTAERSLQATRAAPAFRVGAEDATMNVGLYVNRGIRGVVRRASEAAKRQLLAATGEQQETFAFDLNDEFASFDVPVDINMQTNVYADLACSGDFTVSPGVVFDPVTQRKLITAAPAMAVNADEAEFNVPVSAPAVNVTDLSADSISVTGTFTLSGIADSAFVNGTVYGLVSCSPGNAGQMGYGYWMEGEVQKTAILLCFGTGAETAEWRAVGGPAQLPPPQQPTEV